AETDDERKQACAHPDMKTRVMGKDLCLAIRTFGADAAGPSPTLLVVLHGDMSSGGPPKYHLEIAKTLVASGIVAVGIIRPGYADADGRQSDGEIVRSDRYSAENVDAIADAVVKLKARYKAREAVMIGHSGGSAITGVLIGRHPGVVDRALLISCPCDLARYRDMRRIPQIGKSLSPLKFVDGVPASTKVIAMTGEVDDNTHPELARDYVARLKERGVKAKFVVMPGIGHNYNRSMRDSQVFRQALKDIVAGNL
ncbi:MAG: alpha/beta hydrolase family protein, partial [Rhodospirillales bacterium]